MENSWICEYGGTKVPILGYKVTISVQTWNMAASDLIINFLNQAANYWNSQPNTTEMSPNDYQI